MVDPSDLALLEHLTPSLTPPSTSNQETARYTRLSPDHFRVAVSTQAPALLMLSEIWDPGWTATVNGVPVAISQADYIFQAIPVPAGQSQVDVRYVPPYLELGLAVTAGTAILLALICVWLFARERRLPTLAGGNESVAGGVDDAQRAILKVDSAPPTASPGVISRLVSAGSFIAVFAIPAALIAATWEPLDPPPRPDRGAVADQSSPAGATSDNRARTKDHLRAARTSFVRARLSLVPRQRGWIGRLTAPRSGRGPADRAAPRWRR